MLSKQNFSLSVIISVILFTSNIFGEVQHLDFWTFMEKRKEDANFRLNFENFKEVLNNAPHTSERITSKSILAVPTFTGKKTYFKFYKNSIMHPDLAKRYPNISTFVGVGVENPATRATIVINDDIVIGSVESENGTSHFKSFDIYSENNELLVYSETRNYQDLVCKPFNDHVNQTRDFPECLGTDDPCYPAGVELVTYRFAAMITESVNNSDADGTVEGGLTWLVGSVAYVNALYIRDVTFQLQIVDNNDELIFTDNNPAPEVFNQDCGGPWETLGCELGVVDSVLDSRIGPGGWDAEDEVRVWDYGALFDNICVYYLTVKN